jgi:membrane associated rhomboid family serine protease
MAPTENPKPPAPFIESFKKFPATVSLIVINVLVFTITFIQAGDSDGRMFTLVLLKMGALFNPLALDKEWYRIFTHMFLHGGLMHIGFNMYALYVVGREIELMVGTKKFTMVYFVCGIASALNSLYWSMFAISVGASGAIFGLFGFSLIVNIFLSRRSGKSLTPLLLNFAFFIGINLMISKSVNADNAAHFGGLTAGLIIGLYSLLSGGGPSFLKVRIEYFMIVLLIVIYFSLPRYQVSYYKFFQRILATEDSTDQRLKPGLSDQMYLKSLARNVQDWDTTLTMLDAQKYLPPALAADTAKLRKYIGLRKKENTFKKLGIETGSTVYVDSLRRIQEQMAPNLQLQYPLVYRIPEGGETQQRDSVSHDKK